MRHGGGDCGDHEEEGGCEEERGCKPMGGGKGGD